MKNTNIFTGIYIEIVSQEPINNQNKNNFPYLFICAYWIIKSIVNDNERNTSAISNDERKIISMILDDSFSSTKIDI
jgi:hypothetical protein